jgi:hypothetical protein
MMICIRCLIQQALEGHRHQPGIHTDITEPAKDVPEMPARTPRFPTGSRPHAGPKVRLAPPAVRAEDLTPSEYEDIQLAYSYYDEVREASKERPGFTHLYEGLLTATADVGKSVLYDAADRMAAAKWRASTTPPQHGEQTK